LEAFFHWFEFSLYLEFRFLAPPPAPWSGFFLFSSVSNGSPLGLVFFFFWALKSSPGIIDGQFFEVRASPEFLAFLKFFSAPRTVFSLSPKRHSIDFFSLAFTRDLVQPLFFRSWCNPVFPRSRSPFPGPSIRPVLPTLFFPPPPPKMVFLGWGFFFFGCWFFVRSSKGALFFFSEGLGHRLPAPTVFFPNGPKPSS